MHIVNQLEYRELPYPTSLEKGKSAQPPYPTFAKAGCGLACACMLLERLCGVWVPPEKMVDYSVANNANEDGTDMRKLGKALARDYGLIFRMSSSVEDLLDCLAEGGLVIFNAGAVEKLFSDGGHFLLAAGVEERGIAVLDPSWRKDKYTREDRIGKVLQEGEVIYASPETIARECSNREPAYYLFTKKREG